MYKEKITRYYCEFCDERYDSKEDCEAHERTHIISYDSATNRKIAADLEMVADRLWGLPYK